MTTFGTTTNFYGSKTRTVIQAEVYNNKQETEWNQFLGQAKNGHFMFSRQYMEYHSDRFNDHSLILREKNRILALLPANRSANKLISHQGLTFGGLVCGKKMTQSNMLECLKCVLLHAQEQGVTQFDYKALPYIYSSLPAQEDLYAIARVGAKLFRRDVSSAIRLSDRIKYRSLKSRGIKKAISAGVVVKEMPLDEFWPILTLVLESQHETKPVHTLEEIRLLQERFPKNIECRGAYLDGQPVAGTLLFVSGPVAHTQYLASSDLGRESSALDLAIDQSIEEFTNRGFEYFNFGISTEDQGRVLNEGLVFHKEGFGARSVCHDHYSIELPG